MHKISVFAALDTMKKTKDKGSSKGSAKTAAGKSTTAPPQAIWATSDGTYTVIADHGNVEDMGKINKKGKPLLYKNGNIESLTSHTLQPMIVDKIKTIVVKGEEDLHSVNLGVDLDSGFGVFDAFFVEGKFGAGQGKTTYHCSFSRFRTLSLRVSSNWNPIPDPLNGDPFIMEFSLLWRACLRSPKMVYTTRSSTRKHWLELQQGFEQDALPEPQEENAYRVGYCL